MFPGRSSSKPTTNNQILAAKNMQLPKLLLKDGTIEALKWLALVLMVLDHTNKYVFAEKLPYIFEAGRIVMPLFVFVLAYNLARPGALKHGVYIRTIKRLGLFGILATPAFIGLGGLVSSWWPLNIMFALLVMTTTICLLDSHTIGGNIVAGIVFIIGGSSVEFWWPSIAIGVAVWSYCKTPSLHSIFIAIAALAALRVINGNDWALAVIPIAVLSCFVTVPMPRFQWAFYIFYPLHLSVLLAITKTGITAS